MLIFNVLFDSINIQNTRSAHNDTVVASFTLEVDGTKYSAGTANLGNHNNGQFSTGLSISKAKITSASSVTIGVSVFNTGAGNEQEVADVGEELVSAGANELLPGAGDVLDLVYSVFGHIVFANCDGPCITQQVKLSGADILAAKGDYKYSGEDTGYNSPEGCGSNSDYQYTFLFQPFQTGLGVIVYDPSGDKYTSTWGTQDIGEDGGNIAFLPVTMENDGINQIVQLWDNAGRLGLIVYEPQANGSYTTGFSTADIGEGSGHIAFLPVKMKGDGVTQIVQLWDNAGRLGLIVYEPQANGSYTAGFGTGDIGQGSGHIAFLPVKMKGDGVTQIVQLWDNAGKLGLIVYEPQADGSYQAGFGTQDMGQGSDHITFLPVTMKGDGINQIVQLWDNAGKLGLIVYEPQTDGSYKAGFGTGDTGQGSGNYTFLTVTMNEDRKSQIVQLFGQV